MKHVLPWLVLVTALCGCLPARRDTAVTAGDDAVSDAVDPAGDATTTDSKSDTKDAATTDVPHVDVPILGCKADADCAAYNDPCRTSTCDTATGLCKFANNAEDSACVGIEDKCALSTTCKAGACVHTPLSCDDGNPCTVDSCDPATGCATTLVPVPKTCGPKKDQACGCDDGDACTIGDACAGTSCKGTARVCDDKNACTNDACTAIDGCTFTNKPAGSGCDDGDAHCTLNDKCVNGVCTGTPVNCPADANKCNISKCIDFLGGCQKAPAVGAACDDGNPCTEKDKCNDIDPANGACAGTQKDCDDKNPCTDDACVPATGCSHTPNGETVCASGNACAPLGACTAGVCTIPDDPCNDGNVCTDDACDSKSGCTHAPNTAKCNDGNACTYSETCTGGVCGGAETVAIDDGNPCTIDVCDPVTGPKWTLKGNGVGCGSGAGRTCAGGTCEPSSPCSDGICGASETFASCPADCPAVGGPCAPADSICIGKCTSKACKDASDACTGNIGCTLIDSCASSCSDSACKLGCLLSSDPIDFPLSLQLWLNVQWCTSAQCVGKNWGGKPCVPATAGYAACAAGCESALCLQAAMTCEVTNGCATQRTCLAACNADLVCEASCVADPAATTAAKALLLCSMKNCQ